EIESLFNEVQQQFPDQWLACLELLEPSMAANATELQQQIKSYLHLLQEKHPSRKEYIELGLELSGRLSV
ncbi:hypothetical protein K2X05_00565, partial [bacterium]|nr:hypothetical protein [bacterium]